MQAAQMNAKIGCLRRNVKGWERVVLYQGNGICLSPMFRNAWGRKGELDEGKGEG
jgi:hypothetical protein